MERLTPDTNCNQITDKNQSGANETDTVTELRSVSTVTHRTHVDGSCSVMEDELCS